MVDHSHISIVIRISIGFKNTRGMYHHFILDVPHQQLPIAQLFYQRLHLVDP